MKNNIDINVIATGSTGNCVVVNNQIALDMGVPFKKIEPYHKDLKLVFISHIHTDHFNKKTVKKIAEKRPLLRWAVGSWLVNDLIECGVNLKNIDVLLMDVEHNYKGFSLIAFPLYHDVKTAGIKLFINDEKLIYATDTCRMDHVEAKDYNYYLVEANYCEDEVEMEIAQAKLEGTFCYRNRVKETHLSIQQCEEWLLKNMGDDSKFIKMHQHVKKSN